MPSDFLLELEGVQGESKDSKHPGAIDIESFTWSASNGGTMAFGGGGGAGKVQLEDVIFTAKVSKASPLLFRASASGQHFQKARLIVRKQGDAQQEYYLVDFEDLLVSQYQSNYGGVDTGPLDQFTLNFAKVTFQYRVQNNNGALDPPITTGWNLKENKKK
jgi:type VI secretion system secreted protein Hcp